MGARRRRGDAAADGDRVLGLRQRRLPGRAVPDRAHHRRQGQRAVARRSPIVAGENAERAIDPRNAFIMTTLLRDVVAYGTATRALALGRKDLAGKTGTTNENVDAWFCGFNAVAGRRRVDRLRPAEDAGHQRDRRRRRAADLDRVHAAGAEGRAGEAARHARAASSRCASTPRRGLRDDVEQPVSDWFFQEIHAARRGDALRPRRDARRAPTRDVRDQLF